MTEAKAKLAFARISPTKVNVVCELIRGKDIEMATAILQHTPKAASEYLLKLGQECGSQRGEQSRYGHFQAVCLRRVCGRGHDHQAYAPPRHSSGYRINKRTSHITVVVREKE